MDFDAGSVYANACRRRVRRSVGADRIARKLLGRAPLTQVPALIMNRNCDIMVLTINSIMFNGIPRAQYSIQIRDTVRCLNVPTFGTTREPLLGLRRFLTMERRCRTALRTAWVIRDGNKSITLGGLAVPRGSKWRADKTALASACRPIRFAGTLHRQPCRNDCECLFKEDNRLRLCRSRDRHFRAQAKEKEGNQEAAALDQAAGSSSGSHSALAQARHCPQGGHRV
jgi:hypothetical protein